MASRRDVEMVAVMFRQAFLDNQVRSGIIDGYVPWADLAPEMREAWLDGARAVLKKKES